jgi:hypothetical protein
VNNRLNKTSPAERKRSRASGQALLEFALLISLIMTMLTAAIDLGLAYKSHQTLVNSAAEAMSYLALNPLVSCSTYTCPDGTPVSGANRQARIRFREEQSGVLKGVSSSMDLDGNRVDDLTEHGWGWIEQRLIIQEADSSQISTGDTNFAVGDSFNGTGDTKCLARKRFDLSGGQCFIVVRAVMNYQPFVLKPLLGDSMTIRTLSVKPIVAGE